MKQKSLLFISLLFAVATAFSQAHIGMGAGYDVATGKPIGTIIVGANILNIVLDGVVTPSITRTANVNNYFTFKIGYQVHNFIPAVGFYNDFKSSDNKELNYNCIGYSLTKIIPIQDDGRALFANVLYTKTGFQITAGVYCTLNFN